MRKLSFAAAIAGGLLAWPAAADMYQDGSNSADTVTLKTLTVNRNLLYPNEPRTRIFGAGISTGTTTGVDINAAYKFNVDADDANCLSAGGCYNTYVGHSYGGPTLRGHRTGLGIFTNLTAPTGNTTGTHWYTALGATSVGSASDGGAPGTPRGAVFAANFIAQLTSAATNMNELVGLEVDAVADTGSSVAYKTGIKIVQYAGSNVRGSVEDVALSLANGYGGTGPAPGWLYGISFGGRQGAWPVAPTGTLIGTNPTTDPLPYTAANGVDFSQVTFSDSAFKSAGFRVTGTGEIVVTMPASCTGKPTGTLWSDAGTVKVCP